MDPLILSRRRLLVQAAALATAAMAPGARAAAPPVTRLAETPFKLGVASGEPLPDGMVLWTRLATNPQAPDAGMPPAPVVVRWQLAEDEGLKRVVAQGEALAAPEAGHSVHVEVAGLKPDRAYFYRFTAAGHASAVGRTRTAPDFGADVRRLKIAYGSCQKFEAGYWTALSDLARQDPDLVVFLGDYIYEGAATDQGVRRHPDAEATDLSTYRLRYAWYKADPALQAAHAAAPWAVMWDDHEVANDYGNDQDRSPMPPDLFLKRRASAYQAYYENMPLRAAIRPVGPDMQLYRALRWGRLARLTLIDDRQYRGWRPCDEDAKGKMVPDTCPALRTDGRTMLGAPQEAWTQRELRQADARWNLLGQQTLMSPIVTPENRVSVDGWDGYPDTRRRILEGWRDAKTSNPVVLGGDVHAFFAADLTLPGETAPVASEFVGGSVSSIGRSKALITGMMLLNPGIKFGDGETRGYGLVEVSPKACEITFRGVESALVPESPVRDLAKFAIEDGVKGLQRA